MARPVRAPRSNSCAPIRAPLSPRPSPCAPVRAPLSPRPSPSGLAGPGAQAVSGPGPGHGWARGWAPGTGRRVMARTIALAQPRGGASNLGTDRLGRLAGSRGALRGSGRLLRGIRRSRPRGCGARALRPGTRSRSDLIPRDCPVVPHSTPLHPSPPRIFLLRLLRLGPVAPPFPALRSAPFSVLPSPPRPECVRPGGALERGRARGSPAAPKARGTGSSGRGSWGCEHFAGNRGPAHSERLLALEGLA